MPKEGCGASLALFQLVTLESSKSTEEACERWSARFEGDPK